MNQRAAGAARRLERVTDVLVSIAFAFSAAVIVAIMLLTVADVTMRWLFNSPVSGAIELTEMGMVLAVFLGLSYAERRESHISVSVLVDRFPRRARRWTVAATHALTIAVAALITLELVDYAQRLAAASRVTNTLRLDVHIFAFAAAAGMALFAVITARSLIVQFRRDAEPPAPASAPDADEG